MANELVEGGFGEVVPLIRDRSEMTFRDTPQIMEERTLLVRAPGGHGELAIFSQCPTHLGHRRCLVVEKLEPLMADDGVERLALLDRKRGSTALAELDFRRQPSRDGCSRGRCPVDGLQACRVCRAVLQVSYMRSRTVRLDEASERILQEILRAKRLSVSAALKQGLVALKEALALESPVATPYDVYRDIDLGKGGDAAGRARKAKTEIRRVLEKKVRR